VAYTTAPAGLDLPGTTLGQVMGDVVPARTGDRVQTLRKVLVPVTQYQAQLTAYRHALWGLTWTPQEFTARLGEPWFQERFVPTGCEQPSTTVESQPRTQADVVAQVLAFVAERRWWHRWEVHTRPMTLAGTVLAAWAEDLETVATMLKGGAQGE
jgi:hypothetical protein